MTIEAIKGLLRDRLKMLQIPTYEGMSGDIELLSQTIIPQDVTQNVETIPSEGIGEGMAWEALQRLREQGRLSINQIAEEINRRHGHGENKRQKRMDIETLTDRLSGIKS